METYGAISFSGITTVGPFYELILNGLKCQTIRSPRRDGRPHVKVGKAVRLYWMMRMPVHLKPIHYIGLAEVTDYEHLQLPEMWNDEKNALADGFGSLNEFRNWFCPEWRKIHFLEETVEAYKRLKEYELSTNVLFNWGRRMGRNILVDFLESEHYRIKWAYPLLEIGRL